MGKVDEAKQFLISVGMPPAQQANLCCYVLLAMAGIKPNNKWEQNSFFIIKNW